MEFEDFLVEVKKQTSGSSTSKPKQLEDGSKEYVVEIDDYVYRDRFFGNNPFVGQEIVFLEGEPIWSMNYHGKATARDPEEVFGFLTKALALVEKKKPFRGPEKLEDGPWFYRFMTRGNLGAFWGEEEILYDGVRVYWLRFHGGDVEG